MKLSKIIAGFMLLALISISSACGSSEAGKETKADGEVATNFPEKPIKIIVPWAAGGGTDIFVRVLAELGPEYLGESLVIENKEGAGGTVGLAEAVNQKADGYNLVATSAGLFSTHPHLREVQYSLDDFTPIIGLHNNPQVFVVNADSPYNTIEELMEDRKSSGKAIKYGAPGEMSVGDLAMSTLFKIGGVEADLVPFAGHAPAVASLLGNHIDAASVFAADVVGHVNDNNLKVLGVFTQERQEEYPDVPTIIEQGYGEGVEDHDFESWFFLAAPKDTPKEIVNILNEKFSEMLKDEKVKEYMVSADQPIRPESSEEVQKRIKNEIEVYDRLILEK